MIGAGANSDMLSVCIAEDGQEIDMRTFQSHEKPHTYVDPPLQECPLRSVAHDLSPA